MRKLFIILLVFVFGIKTNAQILSGTVVDKITKEALIGVNIILNNSGTSTDLNGNYSIKISSGNHKIKFKYIGYEDVIKEIDIQPGTNLIINTSLKPSSEQLNTVVVSAGKFNQKIEETTVSMEVIKPSLIENKNTSNIQTAMEQIPGLNITDGQANIRGGSGWSYGTGTRVLVLVDDMPLISGDAGSTMEFNSY